MIEAHLGRHSDTDIDADDTLATLLRRQLLATPSHSLATPSHSLATPSQLGATPSHSLDTSDLERTLVAEGGRVLELQDEEEQGLAQEHGEDEEQRQSLRVCTKVLTQKSRDIALGCV